jgi:uncharacterized protein
MTISRTMSMGSNSRVNWRQVGLFLGLTFGLSWLLDLALWLTAGYGGNFSTGVMLQLQMLIPASVAIALGMFVFRNNPLYQVRVNRERPRLFFYYFLLYTLIYIGLAVASIFVTDLALITLISGVAQGLTVLGLIVLIVLRMVSGKEAFARAGLAGGKALHWLLFGLGLVILYLVQTGLNYLFNLGESVDFMALVVSMSTAEQMAMYAEMPAQMLFWSSALQGVLLAPFIALLLGFGEEFGWRWYLQNELIKIGKVRGVLLLGVIWGLWHAPVIMMGHNYPGYPVAGVFLMIGYTVALAFILGYAVLKSGSALLAAYLHALNNQVFSFLSTSVYRPHDAIFSFGVGIYGLIIFAIVTGLILLDPIWKTCEDGAGDGINAGTTQTGG